MFDLAQILPAGGAGVVAAWAGNAAMQWWKSRDERDQRRQSADVQLEQHRDKLTFDLLTAAQTQAQAFLEELASLRPLQARLAEMEATMQAQAYRLKEALDHVRALLDTDGTDDRANAERRARAFLKRLDSAATARGTVANEVQVLRSAASLPPDMREQLDKLD